LEEKSMWGVEIGRKIPLEIGRKMVNWRLEEENYRLNPA